MFRHSYLEQDSTKVIINIKDATPEQLELYHEIFSKHFTKNLKTDFINSNRSDLFKFNNISRTFYWYPFKNEDKRKNEQEFFLKDVSDILAFEIFLLDYINFNPKIHKFY